MLSRERSHCFRKQLLYPSGGVTQHCHAGIEAASFVPWLTDGALWGKRREVHNARLKDLKEQTGQCADALLSSEALEILSGWEWGPGTLWTCSLTGLITAWLGSGNTVKVHAVTGCPMCWWWTAGALALVRMSPIPSLFWDPHCPTDAEGHTPEQQRRPPHSQHTQQQMPFQQYSGWMC